MSTAPNPPGPQPRVGEQPRPVTVALSGAPPFAISPRKDNEKRWLKLLAYGAPGMGKTTLAGSAVDVPGMCDVLTIDAEGGDLAYADNPRIRNMENIEHVRVTNFIQIARVQEYLRAHCTHRDANNLDKLRQTEAWLKGVKPEDIETPKKFKTVILDSLSEAEAYCMYEVLKIDEGTILTGAADDIEVARFDEFRKNNMKVQTLVRAFRDLPMHVIFICAQQYSQDELKRFHYAPKLTGKLATDVQGAVDIVGYLRAGTPDDKGNAPRRLFVQPIERFDAKNRRAMFQGAFFDDPTMLSIMRAIGLEK